VVKLLVVEQGDGGGEEATKGLDGIITRGTTTTTATTTMRVTSETTPDHVRFPPRFVSK
jgi:hypothetical protein